MDDIFLYNSGSQLMGTNPDKYLVDVSGEPWQANVSQSSAKTYVTANGHIFGAPIGAAQAGGVFYNKKMLAAAGIGLGAARPGRTSWPTAQKIKAAGKVPVIQSSPDTADQPAVPARRLLQRQCGRAEFCH